MDALRCWYRQFSPRARVLSLTPIWRLDDDSSMKSNEKAPNKSRMRSSSPLAFDVQSLPSTDALKGRPPAPSCQLPLSHRRLSNTLPQPPLNHQRSFPLLPFTLFPHQSSNNPFPPLRNNPTLSINPKTSSPPSHPPAPLARP
jgi:hypothetical protein